MERASTRGNLRRYKKIALIRCGWVWRKGSLYRGMPKDGTLACRFTVKPGNFGGLWEARLATWEVPATIPVDFRGHYGR